jgi:hypothetical protein
MASNALRFAGLKEQAVARGGMRGMRSRKARNFEGATLDTAYISAFSALGGAVIGGLTSFGSSWLTQLTQLRFSHDEAIRAKREALYAEFVDEASRLYGDWAGAVEAAFCWPSNTWPDSIIIWPSATQYVGGRCPQKPG